MTLTEQERQEALQHLATIEAGLDEAYAEIAKLRLENQHLQDRLNAQTILQSDLVGGV